jgi:hypothetical protein
MTKSHEPCEPVAVVDLAIAALQRYKRDRCIEIVTVGVELVEEIHEVVFRRCAVAPKIALHVGIARIE